ncbi:MAG: hypothetical protein HC800_03035 [Phormidesmis sp. RL_2_1]|nr:hypothetical protein [Phormidesmis sp. RL_2_1]
MRHGLLLLLTISTGLSSSATGYAVPFLAQTADSELPRLEQPAPALPNPALPNPALPNPALPSIDPSDENNVPDADIRTPEAEIEQQHIEGENQPLRPLTACPTDVETLMTLLMRDLPDYTNRVLQRTVAVLPGEEPDEWRMAAGIVRSPYRPSYVLIAGRPNLEPLDLLTLSNNAFTDSPADHDLITQVFFTTLSRQYSRSPLSASALATQVTEVQEYHWLFLAPSPEGWWLSLMFSAIDNPHTAQAAMPPRESSSSSVGQAVQIWLRDCRAGAIYPAD